MIRHETLNPPPHIYPVNEWKIIETAFYPRFLAQTETLFALGNGYLGMRGNYEEGRPCFQNGTFINGFHETWPIVYGEKAFGFARTGQTMLNVPDTKTIRLYVDDEPFFLPTASLQLYERVLDMQSGTLDFEVLWETPSGKQVLIESRRLVSLEQRHVAAISYQVTVLNGDVPLVISSEIREAPPNQAGMEDPRQARGFAHQVLIPVHHQSNEQRMVLGHRTATSGMTLGCGVDHRIETENPYAVDMSCDGKQGRVVFSVEARAGRPVQIFKFITYHSSRGGATPQELCERSERTLDRTLTAGFDHLLKQQRVFLEEFWRKADVQIEGDAEQAQRQAGEMQQALRWNLFQILQASARAEGTGIPAKGLTGQTYEGHYFWDTEIYLLPFLTYTEPRIARNLLRFRHSMLDRARERAREVNQKGALFPWRTINGEEASAYYAAGTAQYHINADIIYALRKYVEVTDDKALLFNEGAEMLVETARLWLDLGFFSDRQGGKFCIHSVTGPDEYTTVVNNNAFTNLMARENLWYAATTVGTMKDQHPEHYATLVHKTGLEEGEIADWQRAADAMFIPYEEELGIHPQDDNFLDSEIWDIKNTPRDKFPLLLYHHPLVIYRHQVIKQADVVLAMFLLGDEFSREQKKRNFDYYDPLTTGDSSLSACIQSIIAAEIGNSGEAVRYARYAVLMDLADIGGNVRDGCHIASMGGTWMVAVYGFAGMRDYGGRLSFDPRLPRMLCRLRFCLIFQGQDLEVEFTHQQARYRLREGQGLTLSHQGQRVELKPDEEIALPLAGESQLCAARKKERQ
ncbi:alpha,alpha-trehalose phosphorylase [Geoalkalibacter ferrihydriticus]|uniref:Kojibiose phosphorylase n=2 Tax=Geoalkalibacter ferrihydriticus TaxID=392333 RepID=A0A0C2DW74_9BACT|nr:glycosyl hydrolase family 65 protein [Geoalkalibacter ferrihydriticus]KIH77684.1 kojibiose phosphorylase [Geoalkalibacter ferrihydriticus DSM 17813]SDL73648.1 alpha,alpha-trehalose phosphorylase [Geoalkalibacter ferrihydriticus]